jgi:hypothetical protein
MNHYVSHAYSFFLMKTLHDGFTRTPCWNPNLALAHVLVLELQLIILETAYHLAL